MNQIKFYSFICTRSEDLKPITKNLISYLSRAQVEVKLLINQKSIFEAYERAFNLVNPKDNDVIILCHDDIEIYNDPIHFKTVLSRCIMEEDCGFLGSAGTAKLDVEAVWWIDLQKSPFKNKLSGFVIHNRDGKDYYSFYGDTKQVLVLDGLFLACSGKVLKNINLKKPENFPGNWDFYDLYYTISAHLKGYKNYTTNLFIKHQSLGELVGRDSWQQNRLEFIKMFKLPMEI